MLFFTILPTCVTVHIYFWIVLVLSLLRRYFSGDDHHVFFLFGFGPVLMVKEVFFCSHDSRVQAPWRELACDCQIAEKAISHFNCRDNNNTNKAMKNGKSER